VAGCNGSRRAGHFRAVRRHSTFVLVVLLAAGGTGVASAQDGAEVELFWDRNRDGVRQADEPPYAQADFLASRSGPDTRLLRTDDNGVSKIGEGRWLVRFTDRRFVFSEETAWAGPGEKVSIGVHGGSICGTAWLDENADGQRQDGERLLGGHEIRRRHHSHEQTTTTADDGTYCFRDLPVDHYVLTSADRLGIDGTTWGVAHWRSPEADQAQVSKFDVSNGETAVIKLDVAGQDFTGVDTAFVRTGQNAVEPAGITIVNADGSTSPRDLLTGERIKVIGRLRATGPAHDSYRGSLHLPEGLKILGTEGIPATVEDDNRVEVGFLERRAPEQEEQVVVFAEVLKPFEHREVSLQGDRGTVTVLIRAMQAYENPAPVRRETAVRWNLVLVPVLLAAVFVVFLWRRKKTG
jgi:hypothetical protein